MQALVAQNIRVAEVPPELSRIVRLDDITPTANTVNIEATLLECMSLAERFELPYVRNLSADVTYRRVRGGQMVRIDGRITATYGQQCGVTLAPMPMMLEETFQTEYTLFPLESYSEFDLDQPEVLTEDFIDLGEIVAEYFSLGIDPFARRSGAERLPELTQYLSDTIQELLAAGRPPEGTPVDTTELAVEEVEAVPLSAAILPEPANDQPAEALPAAAALALAEFETQTAPEPEESTPAEAEDEPEPQYESLFMKYLRRLQAA